MTGCAQINEQLVEAAAAKAEATVVGDALELAAPKVELPPLPADCRRQEKSGVREGMRLDEAALRPDAALAAQNARTRRCAAFYDRLRASHGAGK